MKAAKSFFTIYNLVLTLILLSVNILFALYFSNSMKSQSGLKFEEDTETLNQTLQSNIDIYTTVLQSTKGFFEASDNVTRADYRSYLQSIDFFNKYKGISGISYVKIVSNDELNTFVNSVKDDKSINNIGYPEFTVKKDSEKDKYYVITYIEPFNEKSDTFGLDVSSNTDRFKTMELARDTGIPQTTDIIKLITQTEENARGFVIYTPVYRYSTIHDSVEQRRENVTGFISGVFNAQIVFDRIFENNQNNNGVNFRIYDGRGISEESLIFENNKNTNNGSQIRNLKIRIGNREWDAIYTSDFNYGLSTLDQNLPYFVFVLGITLTTLVVSTIYFLGSSRQRALKITEKVTTKLNAANQQIKTVISGVPIMLFALDKNGIFTIAEGNGFQATELANTEILGRSYLEIFAANTEIVNDIKKALSGEEFSVTRKIGELYFEITFKRNSDYKNSNVNGVIGVAFDVTEKFNASESIRKKAEELEKLNKVMIGRELEMVKLKKQLNDLKDITK